MNLKTQSVEWIRNRYRGYPLNLRLWNGTELLQARKPKATFILKSPLALRYLLVPNFSSLGEAYVEGHLDIEGEARDVVELVESLADAPAVIPYSDRLLRPLLDSWRPRLHSRRSDARAIRYHYDVSNRFYQTWLDRNMVYSCAYFRDGNEDLDRAQELKLDAICRKLMLVPGEKFLDVGCGWGGLIRWAAKHYGVHATGITLSRRQFEYAKDQVARDGLTDRIRIFLLDYRDLGDAERFDKISSIGMFEHVGIRHLPEYFTRMRSLLREGGLMLNHGICSAAPDGRNSAPGGAGRFMERYVFPHGELPYLSTGIREMSVKGFEVSDVECLRPHYTRTLALWLERLEAHREELLASAGERRYRIWRTYLAGAGLAFERGWMTVYQVLGAKKRKTGAWTLPWTRDHLYAPKTEERIIRSA